MTISRRTTLTYIEISLISSLILAVIYAFKRGFFCWSPCRNDGKRGCIFNTVNNASIEKIIELIEHDENKLEQIYELLNHLDNRNVADEITKILEEKKEEDEEKKEEVVGDENV